MSIEDDLARADEPAYVRELEAIAKADELQRESEARKAELERLRGEVLDLSGKHSAALASYRTDVAKLTEKNTLQRQALDRFGKEQMQLARAARALVEVLVSEKYAHVQRQFGGEFFRALTEVIEVLRLVEVPFG